MAQRTYEVPRPRVALFDIEGTICSIDFVHKTLFPYALSYIQENTKSQWDDPAFQSYVTAFPDEATTSPEAFISHVEELMAQDSKVPYLKGIQGFIWKIGYENGAFATALFADVLPFFERCKREGIQVAIYSSGSIAAQKMLLGHVSGPNGTEDVTRLVSAYYDPAGVGAKVNKESYTAIVDKSEGAKVADDIVFFTDSIKEAQAAHKAEMPTFVAIREGNDTRFEDGDPLWKDRTFTTFDQIHFT